jgi:hypothetical protein
METRGAWQYPARSAYALDMSRAGGKGRATAMWGFFGWVERCGLLLLIAGATVVSLGSAMQEKSMFARR